MTRRSDKLNRRDFLAATAAAAGARPHPDYPLDGVDLLPVLGGSRTTFERTLFWRHDVQRAVRSGRWKYLHDGTNEYLFDLVADEREQADFRRSHAAEFERLKTAYAAWDKGVLPRRPRAA